MVEGVSIIVPAWNEEKRIEPALRRYLDVVKSLGIPYEFIVVVDGVRDRTAEVARRFSAEGVRVLEIDQRLYKGGAVIAGFHHAKYPTVGYLDADSPISDSDIRTLILATDQVDAAIGSRRLPQSVGTGHTPLSRRVFRVCFNVLTRSVLSLRLTDTQCGAKFFRRARLDAILPNVKLHGWAFDAAILFALQRSGASIREYPVRWTHDSGSKLPLGEQVPIMFASIFFIRIVNLHLVRRLPLTWTWWFARTFMKRTPGPPLANRFPQAG